MNRWLSSERNGSLGTQFARAGRLSGGDEISRVNPLNATDEIRIADLIEGNHILAAEGVLDGFGHISVRSVTNPRHFYMSRSRAPALIVRDDIMEFDERSEPVDARGRSTYGERYIHGEILAARPDVNAVVHSHSPEVLPFTVTAAPFKALIHMAAFLGSTPAPVFEIRDVLGDDNRMLVSENRTGAALANVLGDRSVVLMRGHGMSVAAEDVKMVVLRAIYTQLNARIQAAALQLGEPNFLNAYEVQRTDPTGRPWEVWAANVASKKP
jgi:ribulose-5-phosphate 4-epimerase/fuculose-1-phosphate aldolase